MKTTTTYQFTRRLASSAFAGLAGCLLCTASGWAQTATAPRVNDKSKVQPSKTTPREAREQGRESARENGREARDARQGGRETARETRVAARRPLRAPDLGLWFKHGTSTSGLVIADLTLDGAMAKAGFQEGDQIVSINGQPMTNETEFMRLLVAEELAGQEAKITVKRGGQEETIHVQPSSLIKEAAAEDPFFRQGIVVDDRDPNQIVVLRVYPRTPAYYAGLRAGDRIVGLRGQRIARIADLTRDLADAAGRVAVQINRGTQTRDLELNTDDTDVEVRTTLKPNLPADDQPRLDGGPRVEIPKSPTVPAPAPKRQ